MRENAHAAAAANEGEGEKDNKASQPVSHSASLFLGFAKKSDEGAGGRLEVER